MTTDPAPLPPPLIPPLPPDPQKEGPAPATTGVRPVRSEPDGTDGGNIEAKRSCVELLKQLDDINLSLFANAYPTATSSTISFSSMLAGIRDGRWRNQVEKVRQILIREGKEAYSVAKKLIPAVSMSGAIHGLRKNAAAQGRLTHSGLLQIDVDPADNLGLTVAEMRSRCLATGYCVAIWESLSGDGVKAAIRIEPDVKTHKQSFFAAEQLFHKHGLTIDGATKDTGRLMFVSYDPEVWIKQVFPPILPPQEKPVATPPPKGKQGTADDDDDVVVEDVRDALSYIKKRPDYDTWIRVAWAVFECVPHDEALAILKEWSPEEKPGEYEKIHRPDRSGKKVSFGTLVHLAKQNGYIPHPPIPDDVLPLHGGRVGYRRSNRAIFKLAAPTKRLFIRGTTVVEIIEDAANGATIVAMTPERFVEFVETLGKRVAQREFVTVSGAEGEKTQQRVTWRTTTMSVQAARVALQSSAARKLLPPLRQIVNAPVIVESDGGGCEVLTYGYHLHAGGTFVTAAVELKQIFGGCPMAVTLLRSLLSDFDFATSSDLSRAVAGLIGPALKMGGIVTGDFPIDVTEADLSQAGKTFRGKMVAAFYNETPSVITARKGGVGSLDESVANALIAGKLFITLDNMRGAIDSPLLETALRGHGYSECRGYRANSSVDVSPFIWQLSTNGAELTRDLANRSIVIRIRKHPEGYVYNSYNEGDVLAHIRARRGFYLAAVFTVVREWVALGKPQTDECRHDFREWARALDWIVQNFFKLPPLLDGHRDEQQRTASPKLQWLRSILLAAGADHFNSPLTTAQVVAIAEDAGIEFPGGANNEDSAIRAGRILGSLYAQGDGDTLHVDGFTVSRSRVLVTGQHGLKDQKLYTFGRL